MGVSFELSLADYHAMLRHVCARGTLERLLWVGAVFIASFCLAIGGLGGKAAFAGMLAGFLLMLGKGLITQRRLRPKPGAALLCHHDVRLTEAGMHAQTPNFTLEVPWRAFLGVEETVAHCFLRTDTASVYPIPKRAFANEQAQRAFIDFARDAVSRARR